MKSEVKKKMIVKMLRGRCTKVTVGKKSMEIFESFMVAIAARTRNEGVARYTHKKTREESRRATLDEEPGPEWAPRSRFSCSRIYNGNREIFAGSLIHGLF